MKRVEIERLLPNVFQRTIRPDSPMLAILESMSELHAPSEAVLERLDETFNPFRTPDAFVPLLSSWLDLEWLFDESPDRLSSAIEARPSISTGLARLRALTAMAAYLSQWRGTKKGLILFLEIATGTEGFTVDESVMGDDGRPIPFHIFVTAPESVRQHRALLERIIESEKPAWVTWKLTFQNLRSRKREGD
jgi:phage tail-like protein